MQSPTAAILAIATACSLASAGEFNQVLNIGDKVPSWNDLPGVDDEVHALADLKAAQIVVVAFLCNSCPYAADAEQRLIALTKDYRDLGVAVVAINVNNVEQDRLPEMKKRARSAGYNFPYLHDASQQIGKQFGAIYTPEIFVLDQKRQVVYMGALDDSPDGKDVKEQFARAAIDAALAGGTPKITETVPIGCRVRYERSRRTRKKRD